MSLPRDRNEPGAASDGQWDAGHWWAHRRRRRAPQSARDAWAAFNAAEEHAEQTNDRSWAR